MGSSRCAWVAERSCRALAAAAGTLRGAWDELFPDLIEQAQAETDPWKPDDAQAYCWRCGASAGPGSVTSRGCAFCVAERVPWDRLTRLGAYATPLDDWIRRMKFRRQWRWSFWFGDRLAEVIDEPFDASKTVVCPVPMHWFRRWSRGFNQSALMSRRVAQRRGWEMAPLLCRTRATWPQPMVPPSRRLANVRTSVGLAESVDLGGWEVLLVDDVKTSGATLSACSRMLRRAGARSVQVAVAAVADPQGDS